MWRSEESAASVSKDPALFLSFTEKCPSSSANRYPFLFPFLHSILYIHVHVCVCVVCVVKRDIKLMFFFKF